MSRSWLRVGLALAVLLGAWLLWRSGLLAQLDLASLKAHRASLQGWVAGQPWLAAGVFAVVYIVVAALSLPGAAILTLAAGALFGLLGGTLLASFASSIGATLAFLASRFLFRDGVRRRFGARLQAFDAGIARDGAFYLFAPATGSGSTVLHRQPAGRPDHPPHPHVLLGQPAGHAPGHPCLRVRRHPLARDRVAG